MGPIHSENTKGLKIDLSAQWKGFQANKRGIPRHEVHACHTQRDGEMERESERQTEGEIAINQESRLKTECRRNRCDKGEGRSTLSCHFKSALCSRR